MGVRAVCNLSQHLSDSRVIRHGWEHRLQHAQLGIMHTTCRCLAAAL